MVAVIGRALAEHLCNQGWRVTNLSRRELNYATKADWLAVDFPDATATQRQLAHLSDVTHVFYAAFQDRPSRTELVAPNRDMLANLIDAIDAAAPNLERVFLYTGGKVYGSVLGPYKTPARASTWAAANANTGNQVYNCTNGDRVLNLFEWDFISSTTKIRQAGFHDAVDSEAMFLRIFTELRQRCVIP